jgi:hypothetical protein
VRIVSPLNGGAALAGNSGRNAANASDISAMEVSKDTATYLVSSRTIVSQKVEHLRAIALSTFAVTPAANPFICSHCGSGSSLSVVSPANGKRFWSLAQLLSVARRVHGDLYEKGHAESPSIFAILEIPLEWGTSSAGSQIPLRLFFA